MQAWEYLDGELALAQARRADAARSAGGGPMSPLAGLPLGVKDIVDTFDMPTACGSPIHRGRRPAADAPCVAALRRAGAVILGKTVTTEFALFTPGKTRNPRDPTHTPGGSSSGSAAAVAAAMVPVALGSQTAGSVIRPASFCGVFGFKPSHGLVPVAGVSPLAPSLDTLGFFARRAADLPLLARALGIAAAPPRPLAAPPRLGLCRTEQWTMAAAETRHIVEDAAVRLARAGAAVADLDLGPELDGLYEAQKTIMAVEIARSFADHRRDRADLLSPSLREMIDAGVATPAGRYQAAQELAARARRLLPGTFEGVDALLTPSAPGEAPRGLESTGDPAFCRVWTLLHLPCVSVPGAIGPGGLPVGVQLVGPPRGDAELLAVTEWIAGRLG